MAIIAMCRPRIICRARVDPKQPRARFTVFIDEIVVKLRGLRGIENEIPFQRSIKRLAADLDDCIKHWASDTGNLGRLDVRLVQIINECSTLSQISNWRTILLRDLDIPRPRMDPGSRQSVVNMVEKLSQYRSSAKRLVELARRYSITSRASIVAVRLDQPLFSRPGVEARPKGLAVPKDVLSRVASSRGSSISFGKLRKKLKLSNEEAQEKYFRSLKGALKESRVHAEMQLIWYLDLTQSSKPPRIIASHKDACYMCNVFMSLQGLYTVPRSHGRLYVGWRLPATGLNDARERFVQQLEDLIMNRSGTIYHGANIKYDDPPESRANSRMTSLTTIATMLEAEAAEEVGGSTSDAETTMPDDISSMPSSEESSDIAVAEDTAGLAELGVSRVDFAGDAWPTAAPSPRPDEQQSHCENDTPWQTVEQGQTVTLRLTPKLRMHVEYSATQPLRQLRFKTHELSPNEMTDMDANGAEMVYDVHRDLPRLQDVLCRANSRSVCLQMKSSSQQRARRFRVELG